MTYLDEAWGWLEYSADMLQAAKDNFSVQQYSVTVSLSYFATFYAAKSVIARSRERDPKTHTGVIGRFGELAVRDSDFPREVARHLSRLSTLRNNTDYDFSYRDTWKADNTAEELERARAFVEEVHNWINRHFEGDGLAG